MNTKTVNPETPTEKAILGAFSAFENARTHRWGGFDTGHADDMIRVINDDGDVVIYLMQGRAQLIAAQVRLSGDAAKSVAMIVATVRGIAECGSSNVVSAKAPVKCKIEGWDYSRGTIIIGCECGWVHSENKDFDPAAARKRARAAYAAHKAEVKA